jgi:hypothetical protein
VRYLAGDTNEVEPLVSDEEIEFMISTWYPLYGTLEWVAAEVLDNLAAKYARETQISGDGVSVNLAGLQEQFAAQAARLRDQHRRLFVGALVDVGGVSPYEQTDPEIRSFAFGTGMHDNFYAGKQDYGGREYGPEYYPEEQPGA